MAGSIAIMVAFAVINGIVAKKKGRNVVLWAILGFFFSWIALLFNVVMKPKYVQPTQPQRPTPQPPQPPVSDPYQIPKGTEHKADFSQWDQPMDFQDPNRNQ